jgi:hypothetical protein
MSLFSRNSKENLKKAPEMPIVKAFKSIDGELFNNKHSTVRHNNKHRLMLAYDSMTWRELVPNRDHFIHFVLYNKEALLKVLSELEDEDFENEWTNE